MYVCMYVCLCVCVRYTLRKKGSLALKVLYMVLNESLEPFLVPF